HTRFSRDWSSDVCSSDLINMAHGEFIMVGAYSAYVMQNVFTDIFGTSGIEAYFFFALPLAFGTAAVLGLILERLLIRRLYRRPQIGRATWRDRGCTQGIR